MAVDKIVISVEGNAQGVKPVIDDLEKLGIIDKKNAEQFRKNNFEFSEDNKKKIANIQALQKSVELLQSAIEKSQNPQLTQSLNKALSEQNKRLQDAIKSAQNLELQFKVIEDASIRRNQEAKKAADQQIAKEQKLASDLETVTQKLIRLGVIEQKNAAEFTKNTGKFTIDSQRRIDRVLSIEKSIQQLQYALSKAENPAQVRALNIALAEQHRRLIDATAAAKRLDVAVEKVGKSTGFFKGQLNQLGAQIAGAFAITQLVSFGKEAVNLAAKAEGITLAFGRLNQPDLLANLRTATRGTITDLSLMTAAVKAQNFKLPLENLATFFKFAQQRARETGESVDYLVESIVTGIGRKSPLILDNLGISAVELRKALKGVGVETADIGDIANAVGVIIDRELAKQGNLALTTADKIDQMAVRWNNVKIGTGKALIAALDYFGKTKEGIEDVDALLKARLFRGFSAKLNEGIGEFEDAMANWAAAQNKSKEPQKEQIRNVAFLKQLIEDLSKELLLEGNSVEQNKSTVKALTAAQDELNAILGKTTNSIKEQKKELESDIPVEMLKTMAEGERQAAQKRIDEEKKTSKAIEDNEKELMKHIDKLHKDQDQKDKDASDERIKQAEREAQAKIDIEEIYSQGALQLTSELVNGSFSIMQQYAQKDEQAYLALLDAKRDAGEISDKEYTEMRKKYLEAQAADQKAAAIFQATINGALAVINAITTGDPYTSGARAAVAGAIAAAEIALIAAQPLPTYEKGGRIKGKLHREGGTVIEAEKDEFVINRKAAKRIGFDNLEMLNKGIVPVKLLRQSINETRDKRMENTLKAVFGSNDFDTYQLEKLMKRGQKQDRDLTNLLIQNLKPKYSKRGVR